MKKYSVSIGTTVLMLRDVVIEAETDDEAREIAEANGWKRLATNSVKLVNLLGGYGYQPILASMEECVDVAVSGELA